MKFDAKLFKTPFGILNSIAVVKFFAILKMFKNDYNE